MPWTKPEDLPFDAKDPIRAFGKSDFGDEILVLMVDGAANPVPRDTDPEQLRRLFLRGDGNVLDLTKKRTTPLPIAVDDHEAIQGVWKIVSSNGQAPPANIDDADLPRLVFTADTSTRIVGDDRSTRPYRIDPTTSPKRIDLLHEDGGPDEQGIYELDGDTLRMAFTRGRPKSFEVEPGPKAVLVLERVGAERVPKWDDVGDRAAIRGTWTLESTNGEPPQREDPGFEAGIVFGEKTLEGIENSNAPPAPYTIDSTKTPKQIDIRPAQEPPMLGIYELDADTLRIGFSAEEGKRPTSFARSFLVLTLKWNPEASEGRDNSREASRGGVPGVDPSIRLGSARFRFGGQITALEYSRDGKRLLSAGDGWGAAVWDAESGDLIRHVPDGWKYTSADLSADGTLVATAGYDAPMVRVRNIETGEVVSSIEGESRVVRFAPDGKSLFANFDYTVTRFDVSSGEKGPMFAEYGGGSYMFAVAPTGTLVAGMASGNNLRVWDWQAAKEVARGRNVRISSPGTKSIVFTPDGESVLVLGERNGGAELRDARTLEVTKEFPGDENNKSSCLNVSSDGSRMAFGSGGGHVFVYDLNSGKLVNSWRAHTSEISAIALSPDGRTLACGTRGSGSVRIWNVDTLKPTFSTDDRDGAVGVIAVLPDGKTLISQNDRHRFDRWNLPIGARTHWWWWTGLQRYHEEWALCSKTGRILSGGTSLTLTTDPTAPEPYVDVFAKANPPNKGEPIRAVALSADGRFGAAATKDDRVCVVDLQKLSHVRTFSLPEVPEVERETHARVALSADGGLLAGSLKSAARLWDVKTGRELAAPDVGEDMTHLAFSPDGTLLALASRKQVIVHDVQRNKTVTTITDDIGSIAFSPDGRILATGAHEDSHVVRLWEANSGRETRQVRGALGGATSLAFSPDGEWLYAGTGSSQIVGWKLSEMRDKDVVANLSQAGHFETLLEALDAADLANVLQGEGPFTVFAPTDEAFDTLAPNGTVEALLLPENKDRLVDLLKYHVVSGPLRAKDLPDSGKVETLNGKSIEVSDDEGGLALESSRAAGKDIVCSNGVVQPIDAVLLPPDVRADVSPHWKDGKLNPVSLYAVAKRTIRTPVVKLAPNIEFETDEFEFDIDEYPRKSLRSNEEILEGWPTNIELGYRRKDDYRGPVPEANLKAVRWVFVDTEGKRHELAGGYGLSFSVFGSVKSGGVTLFSKELLKEGHFEITFYETLQTKARWRDEWRTSIATSDDASGTLSETGGLPDSDDASDPGGRSVSAVAKEVDLPQQAISPDTTSLLWIDLQAVTWEKLDQSFASLLDAAPPDQQERARELIDQGRKQARAGVAALAKGVAAGAEMMVIAEQPSQYFEAGMGDEAEHAIVPEGSAAEPAKSETSQFFVRMRPGTTPEEAMSMMVTTFMKVTTINFDSEETQALQDAKATEFVDIGGGWFAATGEYMLPLPPRIRALDVAPFVKAFRNHEGAPIRFAWLVDDATRNEIDLAQLEAGAFFFGGLMTSLRDMQSTSGGVWLGRRPKVVLDMQFADEEDAQLFKATLDKMVGFVGLIFAFGSDESEDPAEVLKMQQTKAALSLLFLDRDGANLSKTFDIGLLQRLAAAGLPWTNLFQPEEAEETEETPMNHEKEAAVRDRL